VVEEFLTGVRRTAAPTRVLATVLFTDLSAPPSGSGSWATGAGAGC
jgi:hypothetical protein